MLEKNKYTRVYNQIVSRARTERDLHFKEVHHVIPRALGGTDNSDNLVRLTPREHYIVHALLPKMVTNPRHIHKMYAAFNMMHVNKRKRYTSRLYEYYKIKFYKLHSEAQKGKIRTMESRQKQSESSRGKPWSQKSRDSVRSKPTAKTVVATDVNTGAFIGQYESISLAGKALQAWKIYKDQEIKCLGIYL